MLSLQDISTLLNISSMSAEIYFELLVHGEFPKKQLLKIFDAKPEEINQGLEELLSKHLIYEIHDNGYSSYQAGSFLLLEEQLERQKRTLKNLKQIIRQIIKPPKPGIIVYEGVEGIRKVYEEILEEALQTQEDILAFERGVDLENLDETFIDKYIAKRIRKKIKAYVITPDALPDRKYLENYEGNYTFIKMLSDFPIKANFNIVGDLVMAFSPNPIKGILIRDADIATTLKVFFRGYWERNSK